MVSGLTSTTVREEEGKINRQNTKRNPSFLKRMFQSKDKEILMDKTRGVNSPAAVRSGSIATSIYDQRIDCDRTQDMYLGRFLLFGYFIKRLGV